MKNILFDLDGTITDPYLGITNSIKHSLKKLEVPIPINLKSCIGPPLQDSFTKIFAEEGCNRSIDLAIELYRDYFSTKGMFENTVYSGIENCLIDLKSKNLKLFVATSKPHEFAKKILSFFGLEGYFDNIHGAELNGVRSDKTELIKYILDFEELIAEDCMMIGDRKHDLIGAHNNEMLSVAVLWGYGDKLELKNEKPFLICQTPIELQTAIIKNADIH